MEVTRSGKFLHFVAEPRDTIFSPKNLHDHFFHRRPLYAELERQYGRKTGLKGTLVLSAHGVWYRKRKPECWEYEDSEQKRPVQEWINEHDGEGLTLLLDCCNHHGLEVSAHRSIVLHSMTSYNGVGMLYGHGHSFRLYLPTAGYLDSSHALRREISRLA